MSPVASTAHIVQPALYLGLVHNTWQQHKLRAWWRHLVQGLQIPQVLKASSAALIR